LITWNCYGCRSNIKTQYVYEPEAMDPNAGVSKDAWCGKFDGQIELDREGTLYEYWWIPDSLLLDPTTTQVSITGGYYHSINNDSIIVIDSLLGGSTYFVLVQSESNSPELGANGYSCYDTLHIYVPDTGYVLADFDSASYSFDDYVVPEEVSFMNLSVNGFRYNYYYYKYDCDDASIPWEFIGSTNDETGLYSFEEGEEGCYRVFLIAESKEGCKDTTEFTTFRLDQVSLIEVPNVFSPNGDGQNDFFKVKHKTISEFHCIIMNRWGKKVYEWDNVEEGWNGKIKGDGGFAVPGVYYYIITAKGSDGKEYEFQGPFHLLRDK